MNVGFSQNGFSANKIPSFQIPSFVIPTKTFLVLSFPVSCVNRFYDPFHRFHRGCDRPSVGVIPRVGVLEGCLDHDGSYPLMGCSRLSTLQILNMRCFWMWCLCKLGLPPGHVSHANWVNTFVTHHSYHFTCEKGSLSLGNAVKSWLSLFIGKVRIFHQMSVKT